MLCINYLVKENTSKGLRFLLPSRYVTVTVTVTVTVQRVTVTVTVTVTGHASAKHAQHSKQNLLCITKLFFNNCNWKE